MSDRGTATVAAVAQGLPSLSLAEVVATSELMSRTDRKYVLRLNDFLAVTDALGTSLSCLEIDGQRAFGYSSTYFDTPDLAIFRAHRQDRRRRFKIRTRTYTDSADTFCELKVSGRRDETVKIRRPHPPTAAHGLTAPALTFLDDALTAAPHPGHERSLAAGGDLVLLEVKSASERNSVTEALARLRIREQSVSKYCAGLVALGLATGGNRWRPALRRLGVVRGDSG